MDKKKLLKRCRDMGVFAIQELSAAIGKMSVLVGVSFSIATVFLWQGLKVHEHAQIDRNTGLDAASIKIELSNEIEERVLALVQIAKSWEDGGKPLRKNWEANAMLYIEKYSVYQAIEWVDPSFRVRWVVPKAENEVVLDRNIGIEKNKLTTLLAARNQRGVKVTRTLDLEQGGKGFLVCVPIFRGEEFDGYIVGVFRNQEFFDIVLHENITEGYAIAIFDGEEQIYYRPNTNKQVKTEWIKDQKIDFNGVTLRVQVSPTPELLAQQQSFLPEVVLGGGIAMAFLLAGTIHLAQKTQARKKELEATNQKLKQEISDRQQIEETLHQTNEQLKGWVNQLEQRNLEIAQLGELSEFLQACLTIEEAYSVLAQLVQPLFPDMSGGIFVTSASRRIVEAVASWGLGSGGVLERPMGIAGEFPFHQLPITNYQLPITNYQLPITNSFTTQQIFSPHECWALRRGQSHFIADKHSGLVCKHIHTRPAESLCVPMMAQGEAIGILYLSTQQPGLITEAKQILAVTVAEHIALALANLKLRETLHFQSIRDPLTGLFNRRYLEESLEREIHRAMRSQQPLGVIMLDVDHFKRFNDTYGHDAGDAVLRELGRFLNTSIRGADIACRYGGEELTLILPEASLEDTRQRAEQLRQGVKLLNLQHHGQLLGSIAVSVGVAVFPKHGTTGESLIQAADAALYRAKKEGRDRVCLCA